MAIVKCPECGRDVSDKAPSCPGCGFKVYDYYVEVELEKAQQEKKLAAEKCKKLIKKLCVALLILLVVGMIGGAGYWYWRVNYYYSPEELSHIEAVIEKIENASNVKTNKVSNIEKVQEAYDALTDREKLKVTNYQLFLDTKAQVEKEEQKRRAKRVEEAISAINEIGEVKFDNASGERINMAQRAVDRVEIDDLFGVTNLQILTDAQTQYKPWREQLQESKSNFSFAQNYESSKKYDQALEWYKKVIPEDTDYYELAQKKIVEMEAQIKAEKQAAQQAQIKAQQEAAAKAQAQAEAQAAQQKAQNDKYYPTVASVMKAFQSHFGLKMSKVTEVRCITTLSVVTVKAGSTNYIATNLDNPPTGLRDVVIKEYDSGTGYTVYKFKMSNTGMLSEMYDMAVETAFKSMRDVTNMSIDLDTLETYM